MADVVRLRGTAVKLSDEGGQATNSLPTMEHCEKNYLVWKITWSAILPLPILQWLWTSTWLFSSPWTASSSDKTICVADHPNSEFWQRIGQPYAHKSGRCFVAVVDIEADRCAVCLAELDAVQSEADRQADVWWRRAGNKQSPDDAALQTKLFRGKQWKIKTQHICSLTYMLCNFQRTLFVFLYIWFYTNLTNR